MENSVLQRTAKKEQIAKPFFSKLSVGNVELRGLAVALLAMFAVIIVLQVITLSQLSAINTRLYQIPLNN